ncbi:hypothetical protein [Clostridium botulinum]|uniref:hypothetical protein n=1 Tax=Clostridium botulinum TaxID=1491 RepID=UPI00020756BA|nr:hypothetical protein [Clostridium botulinum]AEB75585.1 conserved hypothetical protein [Clostridium botulinum BKT015925]MCD3197994.1 hypothetical protein [Clostridium botulinum C/D]MCD3203708.1 hypothetical protein [Clostridium botulinum C/D]MCD3211719.1 hypothetical protein [Clostridium botulinum C/D]MCD3214651.1 hypothetical protein [Clostridium botulinum C/D]
MRKSREISVELNYPESEEDLRELQRRKARMIIKILKYKYGDIELDKFINSIREKTQ